LALTLAQALTVVLTLSLDLALTLTLGSRKKTKYKDEITPLYFKCVFCTFFYILYFEVQQTAF
jgi:hypothetical protein